jgi:hypothetical protein
MYAMADLTEWGQSLFVILTSAPTNVILTDGEGETRLHEILQGDVFLVIVL